MNIVAQFDPSMVTTDTVAIPQSSGNGKMVVYNESNISLTFTFQNGHTAYVPAWTAVLFCGPTGSTKITWAQQATLSSASPPLSQVIVEVYAQGEPVPGVFPAPLVRQTNIGNTVSTNAMAAASIVNDGSAAGTSIIESTVLGDGTSAISLKNDGTLVLGNATHKGSISSDNAKFKSDGNGNITEQNATVQGTLSVTGTSSLDNGLITTDGSGNVSGSNSGFTITGTSGVHIKNSHGELLGDEAGLTRICAASGGGTIRFQDVNLGTLWGEWSSTNLHNTRNLSVDGTSSLDNGAIVTNGSGTFTTALAVAAAINPNITALTLSGQTSGSVSLWPFLQGNVKAVLAFWTNYKNTGAQTIALPTTFANGGYFWIGELQGGTISFLSGGNAVTCSCQATMSSGGGTQGPNSSIGSWVNGQSRGGFDSIRWNLSGASAAGGFLFVIGN